MGLSNALKAYKKIAGLSGYERTQAIKKFGEEFNPVGIRLNQKAAEIRMDTGIESPMSGDIVKNGNFVQFGHTPLSTVNDFRAGDFIAIPKRGGAYDVVPSFKSTAYNRGTYNGGGGNLYGIADNSILGSKFSDLDVTPAQVNIANGEVSSIIKQGSVRPKRGATTSEPEADTTLSERVSNSIEDHPEIVADRKAAQQEKIARETAEQQRVQREKDLNSAQASDQQDLMDSATTDRIEAAEENAKRIAREDSQRQAEEWRSRHEKLNTNIAAKREQKIIAESEERISDYNAKKTRALNDARVNDYNQRKAEIQQSIGDRAAEEAATQTVPTGAEPASDLLTNSVYRSKFREQYGTGYFSRNAVQDRLAADDKLLNQLEKDYNKLSTGDDSLTKFNEKYGTNVTHENGAFSSLESTRSDFLNKRLEKGPGVSNYLWGNRVPETAAGLAIAGAAVNIAMGDGRRSNAQLYSSPF